jgi:predicted nucleic acid-binding protein
MIVVDTAIIAYLIIAGEQSEHAERVRRADSDWISPTLWAGEFRNVLRNYIRSGELPLEVAIEYVNVAENLMAGRSYPVSSTDVLSLAAASGCTAYDCEFVALARSMQVTLVTTDRQILTRFPEVAVHPRDFAAE